MTIRSVVSLILFSALPLAAQLVSPNAVPKGSNPPVVFVNDYQATCPGSFTGTFGNAATVLAASGIYSVFFDNCTVTAVSGRPDIEALAAGFGAFLEALRYTDGTPVPQADVVAHGMGGLIVRAWLSGKKDVSPARFVPPINTLLRKGVFLATPNFGTQIASQFGNDVQTQEMSTGSQFLLDLAMWNGGYDDLAGFDALAVAGNLGTGSLTGISTFDDGVVTLNSASIGFARVGRTRVVAACHTASLPAGLCAANGPGIANITDASNPVGQILTSFVTGTTAWQSIGAAVEAFPSSANTGGLLMGFQDANGNPLHATSATVVGASPGNLLVGSAALFRESLPAKTDLFVQAALPSGFFDETVYLAPATSSAVISKPGPLIHGVAPAGSAVFPYNVASGAYVAVYGANMAPAAATAPLPYPTTLGGVTVTVNGQPVPLQFVSGPQINLIFPTLPVGPATLTVANAVGTSTTNVVIAPAVPSIFSLDGTGTGAAAAINATTGAVVTPSAPLRAGADSVELFLTGLGPTTLQNGLNYAQATVTVTINGLNCPVSYAGGAPGIPGLDQVNCLIPAVLSSPSPVADTVVVTAAGRASNAVTLDVQ